MAEGTAEAMDVDSHEDADDLSPDATLDAEIDVELDDDASNPGFASLAARIAADDRADLLSPSTGSGPSEPLSSGRAVSSAGSRRSLRAQPDGMSSGSRGGAALPGRSAEERPMYRPRIRRGVQPETIGSRLSGLAARLTASRPTEPIASPPPSRGASTARFRAEPEAAQGHSPTDPREAETTRRARRMPPAAPIVEAPTVEAPVVEAPVVEAPVVEARREAMPVEAMPVEASYLAADAGPAPVTEKATRAPVAPVPSISVEGSIGLQEAPTRTESAPTAAVLDATPAVLPIQATATGVDGPDDAVSLTRRSHDVPIVGITRRSRGSASEAASHEDVALQPNEIRYPAPASPPVDSAAAAAMSRRLEALERFARRRDGGRARPAPRLPQHPSRRRRARAVLGSHRRVRAGNVDHWPRLRGQHDAGP